MRFIQSGIYQHVWSLNITFTKIIFNQNHIYKIKNIHSHPRQVNNVQDKVSCLVQGPRKYNFHQNLTNIKAELKNYVMYVLRLSEVLKLNLSADKINILEPTIANKD